MAILHINWTERCSLPIKTTHFMGIGYSGSHLLRTLCFSVLPRNTRKILNNRTQTWSRLIPLKRQVDFGRLWIILKHFCKTKFSKLCFQERNNSRIFRWSKQHGRDNRSGERRFRCGFSQLDQKWRCFGNSQKTSPQLRVSNLPSARFIWAAQKSPNYRHPKKRATWFFFTTFLGKRE